MDMPQSYVLRFGKRFRRLRKHKRMSRQALSNVSTFPVAYIGGIERGEKNPNLGTLYALAHGLGVEVVDLIPLKEIDLES